MTMHRTIAAGRAKSSRRHDDGVPDDRWTTLTRTWGVQSQGSPRAAALHRLAGAAPADVWLALAVLTGELPTSPAVLAAVRRIRRDGAAPVEQWLGAAPADSRTKVEVVTDTVVVDVDHTSRTSVATGIQRVARETVRRWSRDHNIVLARWRDDYSGLRRLGAEETRKVTSGDASGSAAAPETLLVPWRCHLLVPELAGEPPRAQRWSAMAQHSGNRTGVIGFDLVPISNAETTAEGMAGAFAGYLAAARHFGRVATISEAAAGEYRGWARMLAGPGLDGPRIEAVSLPVEAVDAAEADLATFRSRHVVPGWPLVLVVGSHEPRKNHLAILHAAELVWRKGTRFSLLFIGGNAWNSQRFVRTLDETRRRGRPVESVASLPDELLWAAYRAAHVVLFPSLNEGFGLPAAEALAAGTPVITSGFGSMREIAEPGGALTVDPRDDDAIAEALHAVLTDSDLHRSLVGEAAARPRRTWDDYAAEVWAFLVEGNR